jgi:hypothetical protein
MNQQLIVFRVLLLLYVIITQVGIGWDLMYPDAAVIAAKEVAVPASWATSTLRSVLPTLELSWFVISVVGLWFTWNPSRWIFLLGYVFFAVLTYHSWPYIRSGVATWGMNVSYILAGA